MRSLMAETGETSNLGIEKSGKVLFVSQVETQKSIRAFFPPGTLSPMHASGIGKALLSAYDDTQLERFLRAVSLDPFTETTLISRERLTADLRAARDRGFALDDEERTVGMRCIAACIRNIYGEVVAGISVSGPTNRLPDARIEELGSLVKKAAEDISDRLGAP
jgi:IclR family acetate operon transcriptional repressor